MLAVKKVAEGGRQEGERGSYKTALMTHIHTSHPYLWKSRTSFRRTLKIHSLLSVDCNEKIKSLARKHPAKEHRIPSGASHARFKKMWNSTFESRFCILLPSPTLWHEMQFWYSSRHISPHSSTEFFIVFFSSPISYVILRNARSQLVCRPLLLPRSVGESCMNFLFIRI